MNTIFSTYSIIPLIGSIIVFLLGLFIWLKKPKEWLYVLFFLYNITISVWLFGTFQLFNATNDSDRIFWDRYIYIGVVFIPIFLYHFGLLYSKILEKQKILVICGYIAAFVFLPLSQWSDKFVSGLFKYSGGVHAYAHLYHHLFLAYFFLYFILFFVNLVKHYKSASGTHKVQVKYVLIGYGILDVIGPLAFLPAYGIPITPAIFLAAIPFAIILAYAIIRYQALNINVIAVEIIAAFLNILIVGTIFFPQGNTENAFKFILWAGIVIFSYLLIRYVHSEINQRTKIAELAQSLKDSNAELEHTNAQLKELDRQKTEFLTIAAHQLRTPLSIIKGYISLLEDGTYGKLKHEVKVVLHNMDDSNQWLIRLADEFLNIARLEQGRTKYVFAPKNISDIVEGVVKELGAKATAKPGLSLAFKKPHTQVVAEIDEEKIRYAIYNYVDNAIKYSEKGVITISAEVENDGVSVRVTDKGLGFDSHDEANFFQKFYRGENVHTTNVNGTGLGLYVCSKFIKGHHGKIWAHSPGLGKGSEFGFWIPKIAPPAAHTGDSDVSTNIPLIESVQS